MSNWRPELEASENGDPDYSELHSIGIVLGYLLLIFTLCWWL